jgi:hypothetical protein
LDVEQMMALKAQTLSLIRDRCSLRERIAADLSEPVAWHWLAGDDWVVEGLVHGSGDGAVRHSRRPEREINDPYRFYRLIEAFDLPSSAALSAFQQTAGHQWKLRDPIVDAAGLVSEAMHDFNGTQRPRTLRLETDELTDALRQARTQSLADARAFAEAVPVLGEWRQAPVPEALYLVLNRTDPTTGMFYGEYVGATYAVVPSKTGEEEAHVTFIDADGPERDDPRGDERRCASFRSRANALLRAGFDRDVGEGTLHSGHARTLIARLLGYDTRDIELVRLDADGAERPI